MRVFTSYPDFILQDEPGWNALRDDFMMSSQTLKDWDKDMAPGKNESGSTDLVPSDGDDDSDSE